MKQDIFRQYMQSIINAIHPIQIKQADITKSYADAIVCPDNQMLSGTGAIARIIHKKAGPEYLSEVLRLDGCKIGEAKSTIAGHLKCKYIIHTVSPKWKDGMHNEEADLAQCYRTTLNEALHLNCKTVDIPSLGTGFHHFPKQRAAEIAIHSILSFLILHPSFNKITIVCYDEETTEIYRNAFRKKLIEIMLLFYSPESFISFEICSISHDHYLYGTCTTKLGELEKEKFNYAPHKETLSIYAKQYQHLPPPQIRYKVTETANNWSYPLCLGYITTLAAEHKWLGGHPHMEQCKMGGVRNVLLRMKAILESKQ